MKKPYNRILPFSIFSITGCCVLAIGCAPTETTFTVGGDSCAEAVRIEAGTIVGDHEGASDAHRGTCDRWSNAGGREHVYLFSLAEESSVALRVEGQDTVLYVAAGSNCEEEIACNARGAGDKQLQIPRLAAGDYYIIVDSYVGAAAEEELPAGGEFKLTLEIGAPYCGPDRFDVAEIQANNAAVHATKLGVANIDFDDLETFNPDVNKIPLRICEGDVDYYAVGHLGGALSVKVEGQAGDDAPDVEIYAATPRISDSRLQGFNQGEPVSVDDGGLERGVYLVAVSSTAVTEPGIAYGLAVSHACEGDREDHFALELDDGRLANATVVWDNLTDSKPRLLCGDDVDSFVLHNLDVGDITLTVEGSDSIALSITALGDDDDSMEDDRLLEVDTDYIMQPGAEQLTVTIANAPQARYWVQLTSSAEESVRYTFHADFAGIRRAPANDSCENGIELLAQVGTVKILGRTVGGTHASGGPVREQSAASRCTGEAADSSEGWVFAPEVYHYLSVPTPRNIDISLDGSATNFHSVLYLLRLEDDRCPADFAQLEHVEVDGESICEIGVRSRARIPQMPAGEYVVVVDGLSQPQIEFDPENSSFGLVRRPYGAFELTVQTYENEFPAPVACELAESVSLPEPGATKTLQVSFAGGPAQLESGDCGGEGKERVFAFTPAEDMDITIRSSTNPSEEMILLYLLSEGCSENNARLTSMADSTCSLSRNNDASRGSELSASLAAGETYHLVVDTFIYEADGDAQVEIVRAVD